MNRSPLRRKIALKQQGGLNGLDRQRRALKKVSARRKREQQAHAPIRTAVFERDGYRCMAEGVSAKYPKCAFGLTPHHVLKDGQGGAYSENNLVSLCAFHNDLIESDADFAKEMKAKGLVVSSHQKVSPYLRSCAPQPPAGAAASPDTKPGGMGEFARHSTHGEAA